MKAGRIKSTADKLSELQVLCGPASLSLSAQNINYTQCPTNNRISVPLVGISLHLVLHGQVEFELSWQLILAVEPVREVDPPDSAVGVDLHSEGLNVVRSVGSSSEI